MKNKNQRELFLHKKRIAVLNKNALIKIEGGISARTDNDPTETSRLYSDGPPHTALGLSG